MVTQAVHREVLYATVSCRTVAMPVRTCIRIFDPGSSRACMGNDWSKKRVAMSLHLATETRTTYLKLSITQA